MRRRLHDPLPPHGPRSSPPTPRWQAHTESDTCFACKDRFAGVAVLRRALAAQAVHRPQGEKEEHMTPINPKGEQPKRRTAAPPQTPTEALPASQPADARPNNGPAAPAKPAAQTRPQARPGQETRDARKPAQKADPASKRAPTGAGQPAVTDQPAGKQPTGEQRSARPGNPAPAAQQRQRPPRGGDRPADACQDRQDSASRATDQARGGGDRAPRRTDADAQRPAGPAKPDAANRPDRRDSLRSGGQPRPARGGVLPRSDHPGAGNNANSNAGPASNVVNGRLPSRTIPGSDLRNAGDYSNAPPRSNAPAVGDQQIGRASCRERV